MTVENTPFLRNTLLADAAVGAVAAVLTIAGAGFLSGLLDLPQALIFWAGVALLPVVAFLLAMGRRPEVPRAWLKEIVLINTAWVVASFGILALGLVTPNLLGTAFIVAQALAVGLFATLEFAALRQAGEPSEAL
jgi:hypothetical protein